MVETLTLSDGDKSKSWADSEVFGSRERSTGSVLCLGLHGGDDIGLDTGSGSVGSMGVGRARLDVTRYDTLELDAPHKTG